MEFISVTGSQAKDIDPKHKDWPESSVTIFLKDENKIIGQIAVIGVFHIEGLELDEEFRNGIWFSKLVTKAEELIKELNKSCAFAFIKDATPEMYSYMDRLNYKVLPVTTWIKDLTKE